MQHAFKLSEAFQLVDIGSAMAGNATNHWLYGRKCGSGNPKCACSGRKAYNKDGRRTMKEPLLCLYAKCCDKRLKHCINSCIACPDSEKDKVRSAQAAEMAKDGPSKLTCGQQSTKDRSNLEKKPSSGTTGRLYHGFKDKNVSSDSPTLSITLSGVRASFKCTGRSDDGSEDPPESPKAAEAAVFKGFGMLTAIDLVHLQAAQCKVEDAA